MNRAPSRAVATVAALAAVLARWPELWSGIAASLLALAWILSIILADRRPRLHKAAPLFAAGLLAVPTSAHAVLPLPGYAVGIAVAIAILTTLPTRDEGIGARAGLAVWTPLAVVAALLLVPLLLPTLVGPDRLSAMADRTAPVSLAIAAMLLCATVLGYALLTHKEADA